MVKRTSESCSKWLTSEKIGWRYPMIDDPTAKACRELFCANTNGIAGKFISVEMGSPIFDRSSVLTS